MFSMFNGCESKEKLNLTSFKANNVGNIGEMFFGCSSLIELDLSNFNTNTKNQNRTIDKIFTSLNKNFFSNFKIDDFIYTRDIFKGCSILEKLSCSDELVIFEYELLKLSNQQVLG